MSDSFALVQGILTELGFPAEDITPEASLLNDLSIDSTELIELVTIIEKRISVPVDEKQLKNAKTVAELVSLIQKTSNQVLG